MTILTVNTIPTCASWEDVFVDRTGQNAQEPILPATGKPEFVSAENEKIDGVDLIRYVILDKFAQCMQIWENAEMCKVQAYLNDS